VTCCPVILPHAVRVCGRVRVALVISWTSIPRASNASAIRERWQRQARLQRT
jgi:hypothetical protein